MSALHPAASGITAMVPCYNEVDNIEYCYKEISTELERYPNSEMLFVDDGSTDGTLGKLREFAALDERVKYVSFTRNFGLEAAFNAGFKYASKKWTVQLDADLQSPPAEMHKLIERAAEGYDVVFAVRVGRADSWPRRAGSWLHQRVASGLLGIELPIGASVFRVARTSVAQKVVESRLSTPYFLATVPLLGAKYALVETAHSPRRGGESKWRFKQLVAHAVELFVGFSFRPIAAMYSAAVLAATGLVIGMIATIWIDRTRAGLLTLMAIGIGVVLLQAAVTARYLVRVMKVQTSTFPGYQIRESNIPVLPADHIYGNEFGVDVISDLAEEAQLHEPA